MALVLRKEQKTKGKKNPEKAHNTGTVTGASGLKAHKEFTIAITQKIKFLLRRHLIIFSDMPGKAFII